MNPRKLSAAMNLKSVCAFAALCAVLMAPLAKADGVNLPRTAMPVYAQECAACHMAFPPGLLPAASWLRIMNGLDKHYGTDASLDAATVRQISDWLRANAGTYKRVREEPPKDRITLSNWFNRKHHEVEQDVFKRVSIRTAANCAACHAGADQGNFSEHAVRIPR
jgi:mono/diheme cytochrome c family protein